MEHGAVL